MTSYQLFLLFLTLYIVVLIGTGIYFSTKQKTLTDFWLAGKSAGCLSIGFSAAASWLTAGALLAVIGFFMLLGMGSIWGFVAPNILALLIIGFFVKKIKKLPAITQPELLELRYGHHLRLPVAIIISIVMILFTVADIKGFALVLQVFYGVDAVHAAIIVGLAVAAYVTLGGLSAVIATDAIQFLFLSSFILLMAFVVMGEASSTSGMSFSTVVSSSPGSWWNPMSIGLPMVLIFVFAIVPGWISEQDPWQRIWAARDTAAARNGMFLGSLLVALVFAGCAFIALGLNSLYPEISAMGFPMGMSKAEPALLNFILDSGFSHAALALCGVALATAAMSCADTFATSGASCIARDIYQRYIHVDATMSEMRVVNRASVVLIITIATIGSFFIKSIIEAIHTATFIASASYFFVLVGGMYWRRATGAGAVASMCSGFALQAGFVVIDLVKTPPMAPPFLESIHPLFMGHGVIAAMAVSGIVFISVSLLTQSSTQIQLAPFFPDTAEKMVRSIGVTDDLVAVEDDVFTSIDITSTGDTVRLHLSADIFENVSWRSFVEQLSGRWGNWLVMGGLDEVKRFSSDAGFSFITVTRGDNSTELWFETYGPSHMEHHLKKDIALAHREAKTAVKYCQSNSPDNIGVYGGLNLAATPQKEYC